MVGLGELHRVVREFELAIFFRNNHFNVLYKHGGELYCLVTDAALADAAPYVVWNRLQVRRPPPLLPLPVLFLSCLFCPVLSFPPSNPNLSSSFSSSLLLLVF